MISWSHTLNERTRHYEPGSPKLPQLQYPGELLQLVVGAITHDVCGPGFRGCPFMNAAVEYPKSDHRVRAAVTAHRVWFLDSVRAVLTSAKHPDPDRASRALVLLRDGSMMGGYLDNPDEVAVGLEWAVRSVVGGLH